MCSLVETHNSHNIMCVEPGVTVHPWSKTWGGTCTEGSPETPNITRGKLLENLQDVVGSCVDTADGNNVLTLWTLYN